MTDGSPETQPVQVDVRGRLLAAALHLFTNKGYAATTVREIVEAAGVTKPVLYYHFHNKEGIYLELMQQPFACFDAILTECLTDTGSVGARLLTLCDRVMQLFVEELDVARLMYAIYYGPPQGAPFFDFEAHHRKLHEIIAALVQAGVANGELRPENPLEMAWVILGTLNVALEEQLCQHAPRLDGQGLQRLLTLILRSFAPEGTGKEVPQ